MSGLFDSKTTSTSSPVSNDPWLGAQTGLHTLYDNAVGRFNEGPAQYYPGQTVANQSGTTQSGLAAGERAGINATGTLNGAQALDAGQNQIFDTNTNKYMFSDPSLGGASQFGFGSNVGNTAGDSQLNAIGNGAMLYGNPYVDSMFNHAADQVGQQYSKSIMPGIASMFAGGGRYGSEAMANGMGMAQQQYGNQINGLASSIYGGNYANERNLLQQALNQMNNTGLAERGQQLSGLGMLSGQYQNERNRQMTATGMSPGLAQADYGDINELLKMGGMRDLYSQSLINADKSRYDFSQNTQWQNLNNLASIMGTASPYGQKSGSSTTQSGGPSAFETGAGIASIASEVLPFLMAL